MTTPSSTPPTPRWSDAWLWSAAHREAPAAAAAAVARPGPTAWESLLGAGVDESTVMRWAERATGVRAAEVGAVGAAERALLPAAVARRYGVAPLRVTPAGLEVATADPLRPTLEQELAFAAGRNVVVRLASPRHVAAALAAIYEPAQRNPAPRPTGATAPAQRMPVKAPELTAATSAALLLDSATDVVDRIVGEALRAGASDVHIEPRATDLLVRFRVDGSLYDALTVPERLGPAVTSRFKVQAGLDIADRIRPQDGRASVTHEGRSIDLRISTLPMGGGGEKVVVRVLDSRSTAHDLGALGFSAGELHKMRKLLAMSEGMVLVTGPTGSGKTTTLYSALQHVKSSETNVVTVEDPIEYRLAGISQVQVNEKAGLTFASALRSILRQDPDVVLVGEIRDQETAAIAIKASMTGHLVLSTLHTNDAPSAVARLLDIGAEPGALSGALKAVVAQRLVRRLCEKCAQPVALAELPPDQQLLLVGRKTDKLRRATGCGECRSTGYRGRMTVAEVLAVTPEIQHAIARGAASRELATLASQQGMPTLWESGLARVLAGATSLHELLDNLTAPAAGDVAAPGSQSDVDFVLANLRGGPAAPAAAATLPAPSPAPLAVAPSEPSRLRMGRGTGAHRAVDPAPRASGAPPRVLIANDDRAARTALRAALERAGAAVIEAADGDAALSYARRLRPDVVVCEIALPKLDALGLLQALREDGSRIPCHVVTTQRDSALLEWARELGAVVHDASVDAATIVAARPAVHVSAA